MQSCTCEHDCHSESRDPHRQGPQLTPSLVSSIVLTETTLHPAYPHPAMGNTPSHQHGAQGSPGGPGKAGGGAELGRGSSQRRQPNLRLPMPQRPPQHSPQSSNPTSPSGRPGSPRRRKSLELPDLNKLSFTPAAPQPTTATHTTSASAGGGVGASPGKSGPVSPHRKWQHALGGKASPLGGGGLSPMTQGPNPGVKVVPVNDNSTHVPSQPIPIRSPRGADAELSPDVERTGRPRPQVKPVESPLRTGLTPPAPAATPNPPVAAEEAAGSANDGLVDVPVQWNGGGKNVYVTGNFAENWRGRIKLKKSTHDFNTILRLAPGQYRLKFIVDDSWRCSKAIPTATDDDGTLVNWIEVDAPKTEEELAAEWSMDTKPAMKDTDGDPEQWTSDLPAPLILYQYLEELPSMFPNDVLRQFVSTAPYFSPVPKPPQLPRILERVILNTDPHRQPIDPTVSPGIDDNATLPAPSHAILNHLMASAQKNGTLGVATTSRYHKKYTTTVLITVSGEKYTTNGRNKRPMRLVRSSNRRQRSSRGNRSDRLDL